MWRVEDEGLGWVVVFWTRMVVWGYWPTAVCGGFGDILRCDRRVELISRLVSNSYDCWILYLYFL
jgi:hypothetical protein